MSRNYHDYIHDIPMEVGRKFYPTPNITLDHIVLPRNLVFSELKYDFETEHRAREQYDRLNDASSQSTSTEASMTTSASSSAIPSLKTAFSGLSQEVLVPCPLPSSTAISSRTAPCTPLETKPLFEFETKSSVFDDVELSAIDDKAALHEILMSSAHTSASSTPAFNNSLNNNLEKEPAPEPPKENNALRQRLITKGFRMDIIDLCLKRVPRNRYVHIEYYMKGCRTMEKTGIVRIEPAIDFLVACNITDKKDILNYSDSCAALVKMGFAMERVFEMVAQEKGDCESALNKLVANR